MSTEDAAMQVSSLPCCSFVETSAKKNVNVNDLFYELFVLAELPLEMSPSLHIAVPHGYRGLGTQQVKKHIPWASAFHLW